MLLHAPIFSYAWTLEVLANSARNVGVTQRFIDYETRRMYIRSNHTIESGWVWYDWLEVAQCKTPDYHALSLADGIQSHGTAVYWKDQFNVVSIIFDYGSKKAVRLPQTIGNCLPRCLRVSALMAITGVCAMTRKAAAPLRPVVSAQMVNCGIVRQLSRSS